MFPVLIVDDSRDDSSLAGRILQQCKILNPVHSFNSGAGCLDFLRRHFEGENAGSAEPCLIFLDLSMAPMNGIEALQAINKIQNASKSCVVMLSGHTDVKLIREGYQLGARTFLLKPLKLEDVMDFLHSAHKIIRIEMTADGYGLYWVEPSASTHGKPATWTVSVRA